MRLHCADVGEVTTNAAEGDVKHQRVESRNESSGNDDRQTRPRSGSDIVIGRDRASILGFII